MQVVATAGHVDHGKSALVRALTGSDPDRLAEEHRRGLSIQLGYCWTELPPVGDVAFVDVPGHERFLSTMLSGVGPVPAVLFVVAADDPWMPQAAEHLAALDALGVSHGVLAVTRSDLADPGPALTRALDELRRTSLRGAPAVAVSARTGAGLDELRGTLAEMLAAVPAPPVESDVRLWVDRCFSVKGAGTVVTGTLAAGRVSVGDTLAVHGQGRVERRVRVRGVQSLGRAVDTATGVARVALNVSGADPEELSRSSVLVTPEAWVFTTTADVRFGPVDVRVPERPLLHIGATSVGVHFRPLGEDLARVRLDRPLPLRIGDRALLRDAGSRQIWGATVLDPVPPQRQRRGWAAARAAELATVDGRANAAAELTRRGLVRRSLLVRIGADVRDLVAPVSVGDWLVSGERAAALSVEMAELVQEHERTAPLERGVPLAALAKALGLPDPDLVPALLREPLRMAGGRVTAREEPTMPGELDRSLLLLERELSADPFAAPTADRLRELGLDNRAVAVAVRAGRLLRVADGIVLLPGADAQAAELLRGLPAPFTASEARRRLDTSRRVVLPLLALLDRQGRTRRLEDDRRVVRSF